MSGELTFFTMAHFERTCGDAVNFSGNLSTELTPAAQVRDWRQRWLEIQSHLTRLCAPHSEILSGESIQTANHELQSFFAQAYHLKDLLIEDANTTGISRTTIEDAIKQDARLSLLADLANLDKHGKLSKPPRSGEVPVVGPVSGVSNKAEGWHLSLKVQHKGATLDGLTVAAEAVAAWEIHLRQWGVI
jgi:hypothetical protein